MIPTKADIESGLSAVLIDAWCPEQLANEAAEIIARYFPDPRLVGATDTELTIVRQAKEYVQFSPDALDV